jgi:hypothetical protein
MLKRSEFLQWALFACLIGLGVYTAWNLDWVAFLGKDPTHITYVALIAGGVATLGCGRIAWALSSKKDPEDIAIGLDIAHYASSFCVSIGLIGTAVGYLLMFREGGADIPVKEAVHHTFAAASVAIVNTVCGAVTGLLVEVQYQGLKYATAKAKRRAAKEAQP